MAAGIEQGVEVLDLAFFVELGKRRFAASCWRIASTILCLRMPVSQVLTLERPEKPARALQRRDQRVLHDIFGSLIVAQLQHRHAQQVGAMTLDLCGDVVSGIGRARWASGR